MKVKRSLLTVALLPAFLLTGCFDLGSLNDGDQDFEKYYDTFDVVKGIYYDSGESENLGVKEYDIEDSLCNEKTINDFEWEDSDDEVKYQNYTYIAIKTKEEINLNQLMLYMRSEEAKDVSISCFYFMDDDGTPKKPRFVESDDAGEYDDPDASLSLLNYPVNLKKDAWTGFMLKDFEQVGYTDGNIHMAKDSYLYIRINNNSGYYKDRLLPCTFSFIDLIIRAVD